MLHNKYDQTTKNMVMFKGNLLYIFYLLYHKNKVLFKFYSKNQSMFHQSINASFKKRINRVFLLLIV